MKAKSDTIKKKEQERTKAAKNRMIEAMEKTLAVVTNACKLAKITRKQYYVWLQEDPKFREEIESIADIALDFAEGQLFVQIKENNTASTIFYLKTKGRKRGYVEGIDVTTKGKEINRDPIIDLSKLPENVLIQLANAAIAGVKDTE